MKRALSLLIGLLCLLCACARAPEPAASAAPEMQESVIFAMDTVMTLRVYGDEALLQQAQELIETLEGLFSVTDEGSEIYALDHSAEAELSPHTAALLREGLSLCERTSGALDLSIYPLVRLWGFTTGEYRVPTDEEILRALEHVDYAAIDLAEDGKVSLPSGMEIDLGSVAKGYTGDQVTALLREAGVRSALLNLGGNVQALGAKPDGSPWRVAVQDPYGEGYLGALEIVDQAVITSGGYERYFEQDGQTYWHILDPDTGWPADSGLVSVTVVGKRGVTCDALSTALFVMGLEEAAALWRQSDDFEAVFVSKDGTITVTEGLEGIFAPLGAYEGQEIQVIHR